MDDYIESHATEEVACKAVLETKTLSVNRWVSTPKICFKQFSSSKPIPPEDKDNQTDIARVLGVKWNPENDCFFMKPLTNFAKDASAYTQRKIFSLVSSIFDPIGVMSPSTIRFKIVLQEMWKMGRTNCPSSS